MGNPRKSTSHSDIWRGCGDVNATTVLQEELAISHADVVPDLRTDTRWVILAGYILWPVGDSGPRASTDRNQLYICTQN